MYLKKNLPAIVITLQEPQNTIRKVGVTILILKRIAPIEITKLSSDVAFTISSASPRRYARRFEWCNPNEDNMIYHVRIKPRKIAKFWTLIRIERN
jgi:hypothetical protein